MKAFSLEEYLKNPSRKVVTRDGRNVTIHCTNYIGEQHIIAQVEGHDLSFSFYEDGKYANDRTEHPIDLFFATEKHEGWVNVYRASASGNMCAGHIFDTEEDAKQNADRDDIATVKIEWEE